MKIVVAISGATGAVLALELLKNLRNLPDIETHLVISEWAKKNIQLETEYTLEYVKSLADYVYDNNNLGAAISSGSFRHDAMVVIPCSMKTLAAISNGYSEDLISRAADVTLKESRTLILVPRESPLSAIHIENLLKLSRLGVRIIPPMLSFYNKPETIQDIIDQFVGRILDHLSIDHSLGKRWGQS